MSDLIEHVHGHRPSHITIDMLIQHRRKGTSRWFEGYAQHLMWRDDTEYRFPPVVDETPVKNTGPLDIIQILLDAIETGRNEPLMIARDIARNYIDDTQCLEWKRKSKGLCIPQVPCTVDEANFDHTEDDHGGMGPFAS